MTRRLSFDLSLSLMRTVALETPRTPHLFRDGRTWDARPVPTELQTGRGPPATESLLERDAQLAVLEELLEDARDGRGALALIEGPPGVGQVGAARARGGAWRASDGRRGPVGARARAGARVRMGCRAVAAGGRRSARIATSCWRARRGRRACCSTRASAGGRLSEEGFAILHALYWLVVRLAEREPLLLVVDDAHWADEPSLRFLVYLAGRLSDQPIAVLVGARAGELGEGELLRQLAGEPGAQICALPSLGATAVAELVRRRLPDADDELCRRCLRADRGQSAAAPRAAGGDRAAGAAGRRVRAGGGGGGRGSLARALGAAAAGRAVARRAGAGARGGGVRGRRSVAPGGGADGSHGRRGAGRRGRAGRARTCCGPAIRSGSPIRWCGPRSTATCRSASARVPIAAPRVCWSRPAPRASG